MLSGLFNRFIYHPLMLQPGLSFLGSRCPLSTSKYGIRHLKCPACLSRSSALWLQVVGLYIKSTWTSINYTLSTVIINYRAQKSKALLFQYSNYSPIYEHNHKRKTFLQGNSYNSIFALLKSYVISPVQYPSGPNPIQRPRCDSTGLSMTNTSSLWNRPCRHTDK